MKEKPLISSFFAANMVDSATTAYALTLPGFSEVGPYGSIATAEGTFNKAVILKLGVTMILIGAYALSKNNFPRIERITEKTLQASNYIVWGVALINLIQVAEALAHPLLP